MAASVHKFSTERSVRGPQALELLDEAVALIRHTPLPVLSIYYLGALPYSFALVYFVFDMLQSADAERHLALEALAVTVTYFWMKTCQAVFARRLMALLEGDDPEPWTAARWANTALLQTIFAGTFFIVYPFALFTVIPFGWITAFYHHVSLTGTSAKSRVRSSFMEAVDLARLWPRQNHVIIGISMAGLLFLFINLGVFLAMIPQLLNMFFGFSTVFDDNPMAQLNSSFLLDVSVFCFLILNPLNKAVYVLRTFYGRARLTGADLRAELRRLRMLRQDQVPVRALVATLVLAALFAAAPLHADDPPAPKPAPPPAAAGDLNRAIEKTLQKDEYTWRQPRKVEAVENEGPITGVIERFLRYLEHELKGVMKKFAEFLRWIFDRKQDEQEPNKPVSGPSHFPWRALFVLILIVVVGSLLLLLFNHFRKRAAPQAPLEPISPLKSVDLESEAVRADDLPEDSWLALAQEMIEKGELRLALRAFYLATLSVLAHQELIRLGAAKSNRDYLQELTRRLRGNLTAVQPFRENVTLFEASWYGTHAVNASILDAMRANQQHVRDHAAT